MRIFNEISLNNIRGDVFGGITAAVIALPMALAFGVASGAGAEAGLYGAILVGLFAALFGGSPVLISEPTGPMTVVFTAVIATLIAANPENGMAMAFTVVIMAGIFQILFGFMRLGKYVTLMPYTVISGFMSGIGFILVVLQLGPLLGHPAPTGGVQGALQNLPAMLTSIKPIELAFGLLTIGILFLLPSRLSKIAPPQLVALLAGTLLSMIFLNPEDLRRIGEIPTGFPTLQLPAFSTEQWQTMVINAMVLGLLGCIDALLTSVIADSLTGKHHNSNKELVGQGLGNIASGLFGGLPGAGATMGTVVNIQAGASTALSGLVRAAILVIVILWATELTAVIPLVVLAGIAFKVGIDIVDWGFLRRVHQVSIKGAVITYGVILLTVFVDLIAAVGIGLFVANVMTVTRLAEIQADDVKAIRDGNSDKLEMSEEQRRLLNRAEGAILLLHLEGILDFGASKEITKKVATKDDFKSLVVDIEDVIHLGVSSALALETAIADALAANRKVVVCGKMGEQPLNRLKDLGALANVPDDLIVADRGRAIALAYDV